VSDHLRIIVLGYLVRGPFGGMAWHHLNYVGGLAALGHDVMFVEDSDDYESCYDPDREAMVTDPSYGLRFAADALGGLGLGERWAYFDAHTGRWLGPGSARVLDFCASADLLINVSGVNPLRPWLLDVPRRALIDTDPAFTQVGHLADPAARRMAELHTSFFTFGESIPGGASAVPDDGLPWQATRQPVLLSAWPANPGPGGGRYTTVMQWDSYPPREHDGRRYGMKSESFGPYFDFPRRAAGPFELALGGDPAPREELRSRGWSVVSPEDRARDPWTYRDYIRRSKGEFGVAKHGYVVSRSGWFSERSACYLASGRPVIVQDTGLSRHLPVGDGLLTFVDPDEAAAAVDEVNCRYTHHCLAARELAADYFDSRAVLARLLEDASGHPSRRPAREIVPDPDGPGRNSTLPPIPATEISP
jgi:hypothetical protein